MDFAVIAFIFYSLATIYQLYKEATKKHSPLRKLEAERYFNGSLSDSNEFGGLALSRDKKTGKYSFKKQKKLSPTEILAMS